MSFLKTAWKKWRAFGQVMGDFVARIFMTVFYFTVAIPFGIGVRLFKDPLHLKSKETRLAAARNQAERRSKTREGCTRALFFLLGSLLGLGLLRRNPPKKTRTKIKEPRPKTKDQRPKT